MTIQEECERLCVDISGFSGITYSVRRSEGRNEQWLDLYITDSDGVERWETCAPSSGILDDLKAIHKAVRATWVNAKKFFLKGI